MNIQADPAKLTQLETKLARLNLLDKSQGGVHQDIFDLREQRTETYIETVHHTSGFWFWKKEWDEEVQKTKDIDREVTVKEAAEMMAGGKPVTVREAHQLSAQDRSSASLVTDTVIGSEEQLDAYLNIETGAAQSPLEKVGQLLDRIEADMTDPNAATFHVIQDKDKKRSISPTEAAYKLANGEPITVSKHKISLDSYMRPITKWVGGKYGHLATVGYEKVEYTKDNVIKSNLLSTAEEVEMLVSGRL